MINRSHNYNNMMTIPLAKISVLCDFDHLELIPYLRLCSDTIQNEL